MSTRATRGPRRRTVVAMAVILIVIGAFVMRLVDIQVVNADQHKEDSLTVGNMGLTQSLPGSRGSIVDAAGTVLASTLTVYDAQLSPFLINELEKADPDEQPDVLWNEASDSIARILGMSTDDVRSMVADDLAENPNSQYLELAKGLDTETYLALRDLELPYLYMTPRETRVYPNGAVAGNIVGYLDSSGVGQAGVEQMESTCLAPTDGERTYLRGRDGVVVPGSEQTTPAVNGSTVQLTINADLNWYLQQMIAEEAQTQGAKAATAMVVEVKTGKIRAAAEWPAVDPNNLDASNPEDWGTRLFSTTFEPGSTFKALTAATIIDQGAANQLTTVTADSRMTFPNGAVVNDPFPHPTYNYTLAGALIDSSNVALSQYGQLVSPETREDYLTAFGVGEKTIDFPREEPGGIAPADTWDNQTLYTTAFGQAFTVTAPQVASAYQTLANGGEKIDLTLVESCTAADGTVTEAADPAHTRVVSEQTATEVNEMLENVAVQGALGEQIKIPGYRIATKTGTAQKPLEDGSGYKPGVYFTSMVGFAPVDDPQYVVLVTLDEPTRITSSAATASAFQKAMTQVLKTYQVPPSSEPMDELLPKFN